jgi:hypothetical protein
MRSLSLRRLVLEQLPILLISVVIAEMFYKFHSFTLETIAFLATWFVLDWVAQRLLRLLRTPSLHVK